MRYPQLVRACNCNIDCKVKINQEDLGYEGGPTEIFDEKVHKCNYQGGSYQTLTSDGNYINISGVCLFNENIYPDINEITSGTVEIFGEVRNIYKGTKARNPDGSVNYVKIELR